MIHSKNRSGVGALVLLAAFSGGCSESLPPLPKDTPNVPEVPLGNAPETIFSRLSETALMNDPELAPQVTELWLGERKHPECFGAEGRAVAQGLERLTYHEFLRAGPTTPEDIIDGIVSCLTSTGVSREDAVSTAEAALARGLANFADLNSALLHIAQLRSVAPTAVIAGTVLGSNEEIYSADPLAQLQTPGKQKDRKIDHFQVSS